MAGGQLRKKLVATVAARWRRRSPAGKTIRGANDPVREGSDRRRPSPTGRAESDRSAPPVFGRRAADVDDERVMMSAQTGCGPRRRARMNDNTIALFGRFDLRPFREPVLEAMTLERFPIDRSSPPGRKTL